MSSLLPASTPRHIHSVLQSLALIPSSDKTAASSPIDPQQQQQTSDKAKRLVLSTLKKLRVAGGGGGLRKEWGDAEKEMKAIASKSRILVQDDIAEALEMEYETLNRLKKEEAANPVYDRDAEVKPENFAAHLSFLIALSNPATAQTHTHASSVLDTSTFRPQTDRELWDEIFHPSTSNTKPRSAREGGGNDEEEEEDWDEPDWGSHASAISWDDSFDDNDDRSTLSDGSSNPKSLSNRPRLFPSLRDPLLADGLAQKIADDQRALDVELHASRLPLEDYLARAYWMEGGDKVGFGREQTGKEETLVDVRGWGKVTGVKSLGRLLDRIALGLEEREDEGLILPDLKIYIREVDAVREVLFALTGRPGALFSFDADGRCIINPHLHLPHLSPDLSHSLLHTFASQATTLQTLSTFTSTVFALSKASFIGASFSLAQSTWRCKTLEAFASAISGLISSFHLFCSSLEESLLPTTSASSSSTSSLAVPTLLRLSSVIEPQLYILNLLSSLFSTIISNPDLTSRHPAELANSVLDALSRGIESFRMMDDHQTADELQKVFVESVEPMWGMIGTWLSDGMELEDHEDGYGGRDGLDEEFFVCRSSEMEEAGDVASESAAEEGDADFWRRGYRLREEGPPAFLGEELARGILASGKAVGLLRVLEIPVGFEDGAVENGKEDSSEASSEASISDGLEDERGDANRWVSFKGLVFGIPDEPLAIPSLQISSRGIILTPSLPLLDFTLPPLTHSSNTPSIFSSSPLQTSPISSPRPSLSSSVSRHLSPLLRLLQCHLASTLRRSTAGCSLSFHLSAIEGLFFMRRGATMGEWCQELMRKLDGGLESSNRSGSSRNRRGSWFDGHLLNASFRDALGSADEGGEGEEWIDPLLVRFWSEAGGRASHSSRGLKSVRALNAISLSYQVPFPLNYLFTAQSFLARSSIFTFLLQIQRAKHCLEKLSFLSKLSTLEDLAESREHEGGRKGEIRQFWMMRRRLLWIVNELWQFFMVHVLELETAKFREALEGTASLDEMIPLHEEHISRLKSLCLLNDKSAPLSRTILSILDLSISFSSLFQSFLSFSDTTQLPSSNTSRSFFHSQSQHQSLSLSRSSRSFLHPSNTTTSLFQSSNRRNRSFRSRKRRGGDEYEDELGDEEFFEGVEEGEEAEDDLDGLGARRSGSEVGSSGLGGGSVSSVSFGTSVGGEEVDKGWIGRLERMQAETKSLVSFLQLGVDTLAKTIAASFLANDSRPDVFGDVKETWAVLSFNLENWNG